MDNAKTMTLWFGGHVLKNSVQTCACKVVSENSDNLLISISNSSVCVTKATALFFRGVIACHIHVAWIF